MFLGVLQSGFILGGMLCADVPILLHALYDLYDHYGPHDAYDLKYPYGLHDSYDLHVAFISC